MSCRRCGYAIVSRRRGRCPECGAVVDPSDPRTVTTGRGPVRQAVGHATAIISLVLLVNTVPLVSRAPRGAAWVAQYLPGGSVDGPAILFWITLASIPAAPLILCHFGRSFAPVSFWVAVATTSIALWSFHAGNDLSADAQAAITLLVIPLIVLVLTLVVAAASIAVELAVRALSQRKDVCPECGGDRGPSTRGRPRTPRTSSPG